MNGATRRAIDFGDQEVLVDDSIINFFHLERSGGRTVLDIILKRFNPNRVFRIARSRYFEDRRDDIIAMDSTRRNEIELVAGHQYYGLHRLFSKPTTHITLLREPISKIISSYMAYKRKGDETYYGEAAQRYSLHEFVENGCRLNMNCGIIRHLYFTDHEHNHGLSYGDVNGHHYEIAKERLSKMLFGTTEMFDETVLYWSKHLGFKTYPFYSKAAFRKEPLPKIEQRTIDLISKLNYWDIKLHLWAQLSFTANTTVDANVQFFKKMNSLFGRFLIQHRLKRLIQRKLGTDIVSTGKKG